MEKVVCVNGWGWLSEMKVGGVLRREGIVHQGAAMTTPANH